MASSSITDSGWPANDDFSDNYGFQDSLIPNNFDSVDFQLKHNSPLGYRSKPNQQRAAEEQTSIVHEEGEMDNDIFYNVTDPSRPFDYQPAAAYRPVSNGISYDIQESVFSDPSFMNSRGLAGLSNLPTWSFTTSGGTNAMNLTTPQHSPSTFTGGSSTATSSPEQLSSKSSPALTTLPALPPMDSRKRARESLGLTHRAGNGDSSKQARITPSPPRTGATSPSSDVSFAFPDDPDLIRLLGGNPNEDMRKMDGEMRRLRKEQKAREREIKEREEQDRRSQLYIQELLAEEGQAQSMHPITQNFGGSSSRTPSFTSQAVLDQNGGFRKPDPPMRNPFTEPTVPITWPSLKQEPSRQSYGLPSNSSNGYLKMEPEESTNTFSNYINLVDEEDEWEQPNNRFGTSNNPIDIDVSGFRQHAGIFGQDSETMYKQEPFATGSGSANGGNWLDQDLKPSVDLNGWASQVRPETSTYQTTGDYGSASNASPFSSAAFGNIGQNIADVAKGAINGAYSMLDNQIHNFPGALPGFGHIFNQNGAEGSSATFPRLLNDETYDIHGLLGNTYNGPGANPFAANDPRNREVYQEYLERVNYLSNDTSHTTRELKSLLENIRPDEHIPPHSRIGTPEAMSVTSPLYEHQKLGLKWLQDMEEGSNKGAILADDMGLGKTVQAIALMVTRRSEDPNQKTTLIVAPVALLKQWEREISLRLKPGKEHRLSTYIYHSKAKKAAWERLRQFDVVLTTYGTLASELKKKDAVELFKRVNPNYRETEKDQLPLLGEKSRWYRVILDEAQCIKNKGTRSAKAAAELQSMYRLCMSGTPMMNNVTELYSLIHFLRIKPYNEWEKFSVDFAKPLKSNSMHSKEKSMKQLQALLKAILLRRTKKSLIDGKPILELPERTTEIQHGVFSEDEMAFYTSLEQKTQLTFNRYLKAGTVGRNYSNVLVLLLRLRQACCHPHLIKDFGVVPPGTSMSMETLIEIAKSLAPDVVSRIKTQGAIECPICMDLAENATIFTPCGHSTCSECFVKIQDPSQASIEGEGVLTIKCPNCRGKIEPTKVTDYQSFVKVHIPEEAPEPLGPQAEIETASESETESESDSDTESLNGFVVRDGEVDDEETESEDEAVEGTEGYSKGKTPFQKARKARKKSKKSKGKGKDKEKAGFLHKSLAQLKAESRRNADARKAYLRRLEKDWETSAKIEKCMEILREIHDRGEGEKTIIFSQFTALLDLLEIAVMREDWGYHRYDGSMSSAARNDAVIDFSDKKDCKILMVSLKAGNAGLNLTAANQVIIFDPFWNPYIEEQAIDRAHRIGQRRPVKVHRILVPNTVEDRIVALQEKKRELIEGALDENASKSIGRLGTRELAFLFGVST
ncbi:MAG: hypothetical protein MMC33_003015 [Icmadophila ericetorum]|nr:hypothetical protein [Icmadophila ericetorum]